MFNSNLIKIIYDSASIRRWNDYPRMMELTELDKQSHKFIIAYFLASFNKNANLLKIIEYSLFDFLKRVVVTDIRPDVFREITQKKNKELNAWALEQIKPIFMKNDEFFYEKMLDFFSNEPQDLEREIVDAAHYLSSKWEFKIVEKSASFLQDIDKLSELMQEDIHKFKHINGFLEFIINSNSSKLIDLFGRLRFQIRWAQTPRIPTTTVLGHMLVVAIFSYFYSYSIDACEQRIINNFYTSLFHDLPETLTKDIISPIKRSIKGLEELILEIEIKKVEQDILPLVPENLKQDFSYLLGINGKTKDEFKDRIIINSIIKSPDDLNQYNKKEYMPIDGKALKAFDDIAAFSEAAISIGYGIKSLELINALKNIKQKYQNKEIHALNMPKILQNIEDFFIS